MRNLLALAALILIVAGIYGYYNGWYTVAKTPDGHRTIDINENKVEGDLNKIIHPKS